MLKLQLHCLVKVLLILNYLPLFIVPLPTQEDFTLNTFSIMSELLLKNNLRVLRKLLILFQALEGIMLQELDPE